MSSENDMLYDLYTVCAIVKMIGLSLFIHIQFNMASNLIKFNNDEQIYWDQRKLA